MSNIVGNAQSKNSTPTPVLNTKEIQDLYIRQNFVNLAAYFSAQNQLLGFNFFELNIAAATAAPQTLTHKLGYIPKDIIVTHFTGTGTLQFQYSAFTTTTIQYVATGPIRIRFYVGTYFADTSVVPTVSTDIQNITAVAPAVTTTNSTGASTTAIAVSTGSVPTGTLIDFIGTIAPAGFLELDGTTKSLTTYSTLYTQWQAQGLNFNTGGEPAGTFRLPLLARCATVGRGGTATSTLGNVVGNKGGEEAHLLSGAESGTSAHTHPSATTGISIGGTWCQTNVSSSHAITNGSNVNFTATISISDPGHAHPAAVAASASAAHNNIQPSFVTMKCVKY